jgi:hypothetical protein
MTQEQQDKDTIKALMNKDYDQAYLEQFAFAELAILDIIDNECQDKDKHRLAAIAERLEKPDLEPLQAKIDSAIYELAFEDDYRGTRAQQAFLSTRKNELNLNRLLSRKADNELLTNYLIVEKRMRVSKELRNSLHTKGHDTLVELIDRLQAHEQLQANWNAQVNQERPRTMKAKTRGMSLKM